MARTLLIEGQKTFRITIPDEAKVTFGPWSPGGEKGNYDRGDTSKNGTLRVYSDKSVGASIIGVWSGVKAFRDETLEYAEKTEINTGRSVWHSDKTGYKVEEEVKRTAVWEDELKQLNAPKEVEGDSANDF